MTLQRKHTKTHENTRKHALISTKTHNKEHEPTIEVYLIINMQLKLHISTSFYQHLTQIVQYIEIPCNFSNENTRKHTLNSTKAHNRQHNPTIKVHIIKNMQLELHTYVLVLLVFNSYGSTNRDTLQLFHPPTKRRDHNFCRGKAGPLKLLVIIYILLVISKAPGKEDQIFTVVVMCVCLHVCSHNMSITNNPIFSCMDAQK